MTRQRLTWTDDVLEREETAKFLYKLVMQRFNAYHSNEGAGSLCFAVDAEWGAGKTFFVNRFSTDVDRVGHPTVHFDAWANDLSDDPLVGFLAQLRKELVPWLKKSPIQDRAKDALSRKLKSLIQQAGKAAIPAAGVVIASAAKKLTGVAIDELGETWRSADEPDSGASDAADDVGVKAVSSKAIEKFFEAALKTHSQKQAAIAQFQVELAELVDALVASAGAKAPLYIFLDELDRCRPNYAIQLLEGIKHLFNAKGVCFVVSTNLSQLSSAVKVVYGQDFDSYRYLKKFFNFEFMLPTPNYLPYAKLLVIGSAMEKLGLSGDVIFVSGLHQNYVGKTPTEQLVQSFATIAQAFALDLRSQQQIFQHVENSLAGFKRGYHFPLLYSFFLAAQLHGGVKMLDSLFDASGKPVSIPANPALHLQRYSFRYHGSDGRRNQGNVSLKDVLDWHHRLVGLRDRELTDLQRQDSDFYPHTEISNYWSELIKTDQGEALYISEIPRLLRYTGCIT